MNVTIFTNENFNRYCIDRGIHQTFTAPGHPPKHRLAERYVQIIKGKLRKMQTTNSSVPAIIQQMLLQFRATPLQNGLSPAKMYLRRRVGIRLDAIKPYVHVPRKPVETPIRNYTVGDRVISRYYNGVKSTWRFGTIIEKYGRLHYQIALDIGDCIKRHIDQIRKTKG